MTTILHIVRRMNELLPTYDIRLLQERRRQVKGIRTSANVLFSLRGDGTREYAFHYGGRGELQFNIGEDVDADGSKWFRYGVALSYDRTQDVPDPLTTFKRQTDRLNQLIHTDSPLLSGLSMHLYRGHKGMKGYTAYPVLQPHSPRLFDFWFLGHYLPKGMADLEDADLRLILSEFDRLLPLYEQVELDTWIAPSSPIPTSGAPQLPVVTALARVCYNRHGWSAPSGPEGKSGSDGSFESVKGFGLEEWLFDLDKIVDGHHYGYLEPVRKAHDSRLQHPLPIRLYTRDATTGEWFWVGRIEDLEVVDASEAMRVWHLYAERGWIQDMCDQLDRLELRDAKEHLSALFTRPELAFNVRFKPEKVIQYERPGIPFSDTVDTSRIGHYQLYTQAIEDDLTTSRGSSAFVGNDPPDEEEYSRMQTRVYHPEPKEIEVLHEPLKHAFHRYLNARSAGRTQAEASFKRSKARIDLRFRNEDGSFTYFEVKTYPSSMSSLRIGIGQLLEYAYYHGNDLIRDLIVVSHLPPAPGMEDYLEHLLRRTGLRVGYIGFDHRRGKIIHSVNCASSWS